MHVRPRLLRLTLPLAFIMALAIPASGATIFTNIIDDTSTHLLVQVSGGAIENHINAPNNGAQHHVLSVGGLSNWSIDLNLRELTDLPEIDSLILSVVTQHNASTSWPAGPVFTYNDNLGAFNPPTVGSNGMVLVNAYDVTSPHVINFGTAETDRVRVEFWARYDVLTQATPFEAAALQIRDYKLVIEGWHGDVPEPGTAGLLAVSLLGLGAFARRDTPKR